MQGKSQIDMTKGPLLKNIIRFTIPIMLTSFLQLMFNAIDLIFAGQFCGTDALAAVGSTSSLTQLIVNLFMGLAVGVNVALAHSAGSGNEKAISRVIHTAIPLALVAGLLLSMFGIFVSKPLLELMDTDKNIIDLAASYMRIYFIGVIPMLIYNFGASIFNSVGDSKTPMVFLIISGCLNLVLKVFFILVLQLDVIGIVSATTISQTVSAALVIFKLMRRDDACKFQFKQMRFHKRELIRLLALGIPAGIQGSMFSLSNVFIQSAINPFGAVFVSGNAAAGNIESALNAIVHSFYQASINFTGQNVGTGNIKRVKKVFTETLLGVFLVGVAACMVVYFFGENLLSIYTSSPDAIAKGMIRLIYICMPYFLFGISDTIAGSIRGLGASVTPTIISIMGVCVFRIVWRFTVFPIFGTAESLFISYPLSWILTGLANVICYVILYKKLKKEHLNLQKVRP